MFKELFDSGVTLGQLLSQKDFKLFPGVKERDRWEKLQKDVRESLIKKGEEYLNFEWPFLPAVRYMDFTSNGNRSVYESLFFKRRNALSSLVMAECAEGKGRFVDDIINGIWCICEESSWTVPAHNTPPGSTIKPLPDVTEPIIDLFSAETSAILSLVYYLMKEVLDERSPIISERIELEVKRRILDPFLERNDFWWMGTSGRKVNNWNPWCDSNCMVSILFVEKDRARLEKGIRKSMEILDRFIEAYPSDGGCDEGPNYWNVAGGSMFDCLELLYAASDGKINVYDRKLIGEIGRYIYRMHISGKYFVNFADSSPIFTPPGELLYRYGKRIGDETMCKFALSICPDLESKIRNLHHLSLLRLLYAVFDDEWLNSSGCLPDYARDVYLDGIQIMAARERQGTDQGLYLAAKGGHNDESHNHNDVGQFIVYYNGKPMVIDAGVGEYTAKTFSSERYEIWTMQSAYHNLPTINGIQQHNGIEYKASKVYYKAGDECSEFSLDIKEAYPREAGIVSWIRTMKLNRTENAFIEISDNFRLEKETDDIYLTLMTLYPPVLSGGKILIRDNEGTGVEINYDSAVLAAKVEKIGIEDRRLLASWGSEIYRTLLMLKLPVMQGSWKLTIKGASK